MADLAALIDYLQKTYPSVHFAYAKRFKYHYKNRVFLENPEKSTTPPTFFALSTLHELGHALCKHKDYTTGVSRLKIEREAWERAKTAYLKLPSNLKSAFPWDENYVESSLDTYRIWLHQKSTCKNCGLTCYQTPDGVYHCPRCENFTTSKRKIPSILGGIF